MLTTMQELFGGFEDRILHFIHRFLITMNYSLETVAAFFTDHLGGDRDIVTSLNDRDTQCAIFSVTVVM